MGYGDLSHTEVIISHEAKLSEIYKKCVCVGGGGGGGGESYVPWLVVG